LSMGKIMNYEIKYINLGSLLKVSFLVGLTVICIALFFMQLFILRIIGFLRNSMHTFAQFELESFEGLEIGLGGIIFSSIFNGILLTIIVVFFIILATWFYNIYSSHFGGIKIRLNAIDSDQESVPVPEIAGETKQGPKNSKLQNQEEKN